MNLEKRISDVFIEQDDVRLRYANLTTKIAALYIFYHYYNADVSRLNEVYEALTNIMSDEPYCIKAILPSVNVDNGVDFNCSLTYETYKKQNIDDICGNVKSIAREVGAVIYHDALLAGQTVQSKFDELDVKITDNTSLIIRLVCDFVLPIEDKIVLQQKIAEISIAKENVYFEIIFGDDLEEEVSDIESPKEYVSSGSITLVNNSICYFGSEESFLTLISAKSLKKLFLLYSTRGLFASNLRFYITSKKIDGKIVNSIQNEPDNFCYFNNGIIITCDDYSIVNDNIQLVNFSIVNGGQTTNLIGRTAFENDFGVICKVIRNKYEDKIQRIEFLSKVAEASNMQKPIQTKDLIANKPEQRLLKIQFAEAGMFLKVKRGEKIDKTIYPEPYMNASNDEVAQLLYSYIFQSPGQAKNSKSSVLSNEKSYNLIFKNEYDSNFLKSIQILKVAFSDWQKYLNKNESHSSLIYGLSRHANYMLDALLGFFMKIILNNEIRGGILEIPTQNFNNKSSHLKKLLRINDIGTISLIKVNKFKDITKSSFFDLFSFIFEQVLIPSYKNFKTKYPNYAYAQFCKSDGYYYDFVLSKAKAFICNKTTMDVLMKYLEPYFNIEGSADVKPSECPEDTSAESLEEELKQFRTKISEDSDKRIKASDVLKNIQIAYISRFYPTNTVSLSKDCDFNDDQIALYGEEIIKIVSKYVKLKDFE